MRMPAPNLRMHPVGPQGVPRDTWRQPNVKGLRGHFCPPQLRAAPCTLLGSFASGASARVELFSNKSQEAYESAHPRRPAEDKREQNLAASACPEADCKDLGVAQLFPVEPLKVNYPGDGGGGARAQSQVPPPSALTPHGLWGSRDRARQWGWEGPRL